MIFLIPYGKFHMDCLSITKCSFFVFFGNILHLYFYISVMIKCFENMIVLVIDLFLFK